MSTQTFDHGEKTYTAAFKYVNRSDPKASFIRYHGVWEVTKNPNQYIKNALIWQARYEEELADMAIDYTNYPNDACYPVRHRGWKITEAWVAVIEVGTETVDNTHIKV
jgi:hypothetical protein